MNIFAGLAIGTRAPFDLTAVVERGVRFTGTSGSSIADLRGMLNEPKAAGWTRISRWWPSPA